MKKLISIKLDPDLLDFINEKSKEQNRSRNNFIETVLLDDAREWGYKEEKMVGGGTCIQTRKFLTNLDTPFKV